MIRMCVFAAVFAVLVSMPAHAVERFFSPGDIQRSGMLACPSGSIMTGINIDTSSILCLDAYDGLLFDEQVDGSPATQWPREEGVPFIESVVRASHAYSGPTLHSCSKDRIMTGVHLGRNAFLCSQLRRLGVIEVLGRYQVVQRQTRNGALACPRGMAMAGLHAGNRTLLCAEVRLCRQNDQCSAGNRCKTNEASARQNGLYCRPPGAVRLHKDDNCRGDIVRSVGAASGTGIRNLGSDGDDARSALFLGVKDGTIMEVYDDSNFSKGDDFAIITTRRDVAAGCVGNLDLPPNRTILDVNVSGTKPTGGNLAGKVSSLRFFSQIKHTDGRCLGRRVPARSGRTAEKLLLGGCTDPGAVQWYRFEDGTIKINGLRLDRCLAAFVDGFQSEIGERFQPGEITLKFCDRLQDDVRWTHTPEGQLKIYSNYCLTRPDGPLARTPRIEPCQLPVPETQIWSANF